VPVGDSLSSQIKRTAGRELFGIDSTGYDAGRPEYPQWVYDRLSTLGGLREGTRVVEVGPGTGIVTRRLLSAGARVTAVEPDPALGRHLRDTLVNDGLKIVNAPFEDSGLADDSADLVVAATSFHWVERDAGMRALRRLLRPGGHVALWWTLFFDHSRPDAFSEATKHLFCPVPAEFDEPGRPEFQLDVEHRCGDLMNLAGFVDVRAEVAHWDIRLPSQRVRDLYASMAVIRRLEPTEQRRILDELTRIADGKFGGLVDRPFVTALYTARKPDHDEQPVLLSREHRDRSPGRDEPGRS
jgi:SAM-dependent methyltransferase